MKEKRLFWKLIWLGKILAEKTEKLVIKINWDGKLGPNKIEDGSVWTFYLKNEMISIQQFSLGKEDCQLNARTDNLGIIEEFMKTAQHYELAVTLTIQLTFEKILKKRRF